MTLETDIRMLWDSERKNARNLSGKWKKQETDLSLNLPKGRTMVITLRPSGCSRITSPSHDSWERERQAKGLFKGSRFKKIFSN